MNYNIISNNAVLVFNENISPFFKTDGIEATIAAVFADLNPQPIITKFPERISIFIPEAQVSLVVANSVIIVSDLKVGEFAKKDNLAFATLINKARNIINKDTIAYGYNYAYQVDGKSFSELANMAQQSFCKDDLSALGPIHANIKYVLPSFTIENGNCKIAIKISPAINSPGSEEMDKLIIESNVHFNENLPDLAEMLASYDQRHKEVFDIIKTVFHE
jgi:hypothetical protein